MKPNNSFSEMAAELWADDEFAFQAKAQDIAIKLASAVSEAGLNQAQLAEKLEWKASRVSRVLTGSTNHTIKTMHQICQAVGRDFDIVLRRPHEQSLVVDQDYRHAYLVEASNNLEQSKVLLDTAKGLNLRSWRNAQETKRFNRPEYSNQPTRASAR